MATFLLMRQTSGISGGFCVLLALLEQENGPIGLPFSNSSLLGQEYDKSNGDNYEPRHFAIHLSGKPAG